MFQDEEIRKARQEEKRREKRGKYKPSLPRDKQTELEIQKIFNYGTERELMTFLRKNGVPDGSERFVQIVKLFREHGGKRSKPVDAVLSEPFSLRLEAKKQNALPEALPLE